MGRFISVITKNFPIKIISVFIAVVIWYMVVYNNDPIITQSYQVHINVENESYIANGKQLYMIDEEYKTVTVYVKANRSQLDSISADDINVTADLTQIVDLDRTPVMVPLSVSCDGIDQTDISLSRNAIPITIENVESKELSVSVSTEETVVNKDYEIGKMTPSPSAITIYGPESVINNIESAVVKIDVSGLAEDKTLTGKLAFIDKNQDEISDTIMQDDITIEGGEPDMTVDVELWKKQSDISIQVGYSGSPANGYQIGTITTTPDNLTLAGTDDALKLLAQNGNKIVIPSSVVDVTGLSSDKQIEIDLAEYLPENTKLSSSMNETATIYITVLPVGAIEFSLDVDDIEVKNLASSLTVSYDKKSVVMRISGDSDVLNALKAENIKASIDLKNYTVGDYSIPISITLPDGCSLVESASISIHIKEGAEKETSTEKNG